MKGIVVFPCVYVLKLEDGCYYVGITMDLNKRLSQHWIGEGAKWTKLHKPVSVERIIFPAEGDTIENDTTKAIMELYGKENVRGGSWCKVE